MNKTNAVATVVLEDGAIKIRWGRHYDGMTEEERAEVLGVLARDILQERSSIRVGSIFETLSPTEREIAELAMRGMPSAEIGERLGKPKRTIDSHRRNIIRKTGLSTLQLTWEAAIERAKQ